ncbi:hypothetical protein [Altererythrobacter sp. ZODW24]|uniref:hypothetical protein n=1 Tax=Altererythrobacter sp. ZODW24 TaxID=2185142 RepID=UPI0013B3CBEA|nr:hypothetical protein [Altererythrobacter sp. ZODW24]
MNPSNHLPLRPLSALTLAIAAVAALAPAAQAQDPSGGGLQDFQLPPSPTPTSTPEVQGPVDPDSPATQPRVIQTPRPTPTPTPRATQPIVIPTPTPSPTLPNRRFTPATNAPPAVIRPSAPIGELPSEPQTAPTDLAPATPQTGTPSPTLPQPADTQPAVLSETTAVSDGGNSAWIWIAALLAALGLAFAIWRWLIARKSAPVAEIERPAETLARNTDLPEPALKPEAEPAPEIPQQQTTPITPDEPLAVAFQPLSLALSMMNATLSYRISITPGAGIETEAMTIGADMIAAHASMPVGQQLADTAIMLPERHGGIALRAGESLELNGTITLPIADIRPIRQGNAALFVPLVRLTFDNVGQAVDPMTFVLGEDSALQTGKLQPLRIDAGPRTVRQMIARRLG